MHRLLALLGLPLLSLQPGVHLARGRGATLCLLIVWQLLRLGNLYGVAAASAGGSGIRARLLLLSAGLQPFRTMALVMSGSLSHRPPLKGKSPW